MRGGGGGNLEAFVHLALGVCNWWWESRTPDSSVPPCIWTNLPWRLVVASGTERELGLCLTGRRRTRELTHVAISVYSCQQLLGNSVGGPLSPSSLSSPSPVLLHRRHHAERGRGEHWHTLINGSLSSEHHAVPESCPATELLLFSAGDCWQKHSPRCNATTAIIAAGCCLAPTWPAAGLVACCQSAEPFGACPVAGI